MAVKTYQIDIASNPSVIIITAEPIANNISEIIPVAHIRQVTPVYFDYTATEDFASGPAKDTSTQFAETYPYPTMTRMIIETFDEGKFDIECQSVTNQAAWSTGLKTGLAQAIADINALL